MVDINSYHYYMDAGLPVGQVLNTQQPVNTQDLTDGSHFLLIWDSVMICVSSLNNKPIHSDCLDQCYHTEPLHLQAH